MNLGETSHSLPLVLSIFPSSSLSLKSIVRMSIDQTWHDAGEQGKEGGGASHQWKITRDTKGSGGIIRQIRIIIYSQIAGRGRESGSTDGAMHEYECTRTEGFALCSSNLPLSDEEHVLGLLADAGPLPADAGVGDVQWLRKTEVKPLSLPRLRHLAS